MKRFALLLAFCLPMIAAPWDGVRGGLTIMTLTTDLTALRSFASAPLFPYVTTFAVLPDNSEVNNVRVTFLYRDDFGNLKRAVVEGEPQSSSRWIWMAFPVRPSQIEGEPYFEARIIKTPATAGSPVPHLPTTSN